jgi:hypothetical protein
MGMAGVQPVWRADAVNMAEAAAMRDTATVLKLIRAGADPDERLMVRAGALFDQPIALTPTEAAIAARRPEVVELLHTAAGDRVDWTYARCLADLVGSRETVDVLDRHRPSSRGDCTGVRTPW